LPGQSPLSTAEMGEAILRELDAMVALPASAHA